MSELEDRINSILGDPEQMEKLTKMAQSLMGGSGEAKKPAGTPDALGDLAKTLGGGAGEEPLIDPALLGKIGQLMAGSGARSQEERTLLEAMKPYLSEKRRKKMDRALKLAQLAKVAKLAMGEMGEDSGL